MSEIQFAVQPKFELGRKWRLLWGEVASHLCGTSSRICPACEPKSFRKWSKS